jgi:Tfp pilus assembly protein PilF
LRKNVSPKGHRDREGEAETLNKIGELLLATAEPKQARREFDQALAIATDIGSPPAEARALEGKGRCEIQLGRRTEAITAPARAVDIYRHIESPNAQRAEAMLRSLRDGV